MSLPLSPYQLGKTVSFASQTDPRFSFCLYVPPSYRSAASGPILVTVHGTDRNNQSLRDLFCDFADETNSIVLSPLFPVGVEANDLDNYKYLGGPGIRFDELLLSMVDEVSQRYEVDGSRFLLFGFSGGAHLAHRMLYVHPERLRAVVVGAPGGVTLPDQRLAWWAGVKDYAELFGRAVPWERMREIPVHLVVGAEDTDPKGTIQNRHDPRWIDGADQAGSHRVARLRSLYQQLHSAGLQVSLDMLDGVRHELAPVAAEGIRFFRGVSA